MEKDIVIEEMGRGGIVLYQTPDGKTNLDVKLENETVWLNAEQMAILFDRDRTVIQRHIRNIYREEELERSITCAKFAHMGIDNDQVFQVPLKSGLFTVLFSFLRSLFVQFAAVSNRFLQRQERWLKLRRIFQYEFVLYLKISEKAQ